MPAIREHDVPIDDDDGMPPLVDNPNPSMTFTFFTDMTPITALSADPTVPFESVWDAAPPPGSGFEFSSGAASPAELAEFFSDGERAPGQDEVPAPLDRVSHGKKRDASYIPRPPNAFILFRSSFIRSQQVPEKVEGNHSTLSKIIGKYWKTLSREEREVWEAKALVAQAEHRKRYPDWRFRPGANALAKVKVKDGPQASNRKRASQTGRKANPANKKTKSGDERCAMIADLLVEGKTGVDLEDAVRRWEDRTGARKEDGSGVEDVVEPKQVAVAATTTQVVVSPPPVRALTPDVCHDDGFWVPLTAMFKRSVSAPAAHHREDSLESVFANISYEISEPQQQGGGEHGPAAVPGDAVGCLSPLVLPSVLREGVPARWNDPYNLLETSIGLPPSPDCAGLAAYVLHTPAASSSPVGTGYDLTAVGGSEFDDGKGPAAYANDTAHVGCGGGYCAPKSWAECAALQTQQTPVFVNASAYDWCAPPLEYGGGYVLDGSSSCYDMSDPLYHFRALQMEECLHAVAY